MFWAFESTQSEGLRSYQHFGGHVSSLGLCVCVGGGGLHARTCSLFFDSAYTQLFLFCFNVLFSLRLSLLLLLWPFNVLCVPITNHLTQAWVGLQSTFGVHEPCLLLLMTFTRLRSKWCCFWPSELQVRWHRDEFLKQSPDRLECFQLSLFYFF